MVKWCCLSKYSEHLKNGWSQTLLRSMQNEWIYQKKPLKRSSRDAMNKKYQHFGKSPQKEVPFWLVTQAYKLIATLLQMPASFDTNELVHPSPGSLERYDLFLLNVKHQYGSRRMSTCRTTNCVNKRTLCVLWNDLEIKNGATSTVLYFEIISDRATPSRSRTVSLHWPRRRCARLGVTRQ